MAHYKLGYKYHYGVHIPVSILRWIRISTTDITLICTKRNSGQRHDKMLIKNETGPLASVLLIAISTYDEASRKCA